MTTIHLEGAGGNLGCTEKLYMEITDFILVVNNKRYRFDTTNGNLSILCINGVNETTDVKNGYKNLIITASDDTYDDYGERRKEYLDEVERIKQGGCKECSCCCKNSIMYDPFCTASGEKFRDPDSFETKIPARGSKCPFAD